MNPLIKEAVTAARKSKPEEMKEVINKALAHMVIESLGQIKKDIASKIAR